MKTAEEYLKSRIKEHNVRHLIDQLDPIYQGELIAILESFAKGRERESLEKFLAFYLGRDVKDSAVQTDIDEFINNESHNKKV